MTLPQWWYEELRSLAVRSRQVVFLAALTGALTGLGVALYETVVVDGLIVSVLGAPVWAQGLIPVVGLALTVVILRYGGPNASPSTADEYIKNFHDPGTRLSIRKAASRLIASVATLGSGGALGLEGPSIYIGATIGSRIHHRLPPKFRGNARTLLVAGAAAGVSAIFKAPATGAVFALEVPYRDDLGRRSLLPAMVSAVTGYLVFVTIKDTTPLLPIEGVQGLEGKNLAAAAVVGVLAGLAAQVFSRGVRWAKRFQVETNPAVRVLTAGAATIAVFVVVRVAARESLTLESGLGVVNWALDPNLAVWVLVVVLVMRCIATTASVAGGGVGGLVHPPRGGRGPARTCRGRRGQLPRGVPVRRGRNSGVPVGGLPGSAGRDHVRRRDDRATLLRRPRSDRGRRRGAGRRIELRHRLPTVPGLPGHARPDHITVGHITVRNAYATFLD